MYEAGYKTPFTKPFGATKFIMHKQLLLLATICCAGELLAQDAHRIHTAALVVDTHNDVLYRSVMRGKDIGTRINAGHTDLPRIKEGGIDVQVFAVWCDET